MIFITIVISVIINLIITILFLIGYSYRLSKELEIFENRIDKKIELYKVNKNERINQSLILVLE